LTTETGVLDTTRAVLLLKIKNTSKTSSALFTPDKSKSNGISVKEETVTFHQQGSNQAGTLLLDKWIGAGHLTTRDE
jgi:hypothetical protein